MAKQKKRVRRQLRMGLLTKLLVVLLLAALGCQVYALREQVADAEAEKARVAALVERRRQENDALTEDIAEGCTPEKMQEIARRELGWALPGEYVFDVGS
ncbi:septum formation initiator family protein [uncultured Oscillibacter sp.]|uniref:septum formation initiator family protein n=1 Tax=uncultured Oscillibacter sp. TaxID=876091 RepID=UPI0025F665C3|nr:septum formation initiator family protein [uncultured Oscillibacter sp.]